VTPMPSYCNDERVEVVLGTFDGSMGLPLREPLSAGDTVSIFHFAGLLQADQHDRLEHCIRVNVELTRNLLTAAKTISEAGLLKAPVRFMLLTLSPASPACLWLQQLGRGSKLEKWKVSPYGNTQGMGEQLVFESMQNGGGSFMGFCARAPGLLALNEFDEISAGLRDEVTQALASSLQGNPYTTPLTKTDTFCITTMPALMRNLILLHDLEVHSLLQEHRERLETQPVYLPGLMTALPPLVDALKETMPDKAQAMGDITYYGKQSSSNSTCVIDTTAWVEELQLASSLGLESSPPMVKFWEQAFLKGGRNSTFVAPTQNLNPPVQALNSARTVASSMNTTVLCAPTANLSNGPKRRVAVVTGAGSGVGRAAAIALVRKANFNTVVLLGRRQEPLEETAAFLLCNEDDSKIRDTWCVTCDISEPAEVAQVFDQVRSRYGRLDLLFNNAGVGTPQVPLDELPLDAWQKCIGTNMTGTFLCTKEAFRLMKQQNPRGGRIINNGSVSADRPRPNTAPYTATKHAMTGLTKSMALDGRPFDIACGQIDIGNAMTPMGEKLGEGALQASGKTVPEPLIDVNIVGNAVAYMASLPLEANVPFMTVMATKMPLYGRG